jgi:hypothetical protein
MTLFQARSIVSLVACYDQVKDEVTQAFNLLASAKQKLEKFDIYNQVIPDRCCDFAMDGLPEKAIRMIRGNTWRFIIAKSNMREWLTRKRTLELDEMLGSDRLPEITVQSITEFFWIWSSD